MSSGQNGAPQKLTDYCESILKRTWSNICSGSFPHEMRQKYSGYHVIEGEPYSIFHLDKNLRKYLVVFRSDPASSCKRLEFLNGTSFLCFQKFGKPKIFRYPHGKFSCVNYSFRMVDELVTFCCDRQLAENEFTAIFYTEYREETFSDFLEHSAASVNFLSIGLILLVVIIALILFLRMR